jgi:hypothetical protein
VIIACLLCLLACALHGTNTFRNLSDACLLLATGGMPGTPGGFLTGSSGSSSSNAAILSGHCLLVMAVTYDGRLWQWQVQLPRYPKRSFLADSDEPIAAINSSIQVWWCCINLIYEGSAMP